MSKSLLKIEASTTGTSGQIRIVDMISMFSVTSAERIRAIVDEFLEKGIENTNVYINSRGGSTVEAKEIVNELERLPSVKLTIGAVAASAGTYPMTKFYSSAYPNSQFMIHRPKLTASGDINAIKADLKLLEDVTQDYKEAYAAKMGKTEEDVEALFAKGDYWMTAKEAKEIGLLDEIITAKNKLTTADLELLVACGAPIIPKIKTEDTPMKNRNQIIASLKLAADATDEQIEVAVAAAVEKSGQVDALRDAQAKAQEKEAESIVDKAILDKKITADLKDTYVKLAKNDLESTKAVLEAMPAVEKASAHFQAGSAASGSGREKWTLEDYQTKDPDALAEMIVKEPKKFEQLEADYFGS